ncbi:ABC transporter permease subunit [Cocleimonas sp. KMM 6892]|uniref:ABC transporter permease subunit n=1 Tax=unclassified Cocleimonas TaxID=2639732 RepID=UPI002DBE7178|nr:MULTISPECIES: ABC transporter permease subunit [unclassified Cocleimonas]MEB8431663.1 ABC transporter permease subunit [Cocleimonas sp. KMM 6892]MEC4713565.1 ABC transporter permease subunit [Cocleimonas sp. KMM 6895]MEC4742896.1 ABC transporter permease subunit [Cocleimonas sp. KMM 6896]
MSLGLNKISTIAISEFKRMFNSPLAWSVLAILQFILAMIFLSRVDEFVAVFQQQMATADNAPGATFFIISPVYLWAGIIMLAVMPIMTMRLFAEERMNKTLTLLKSSPVSSTQIVLGKYGGVLLFVVLFILMISLMPIALSFGTELDWGIILSSTLGLFLLLASFAAAGLFLSSLTSQPIIAAISSFGLLMFLVVLYLSGGSQSNSSELFIYLSHFSHFETFVRGIIDSSDIVYYLLFIVGFIILSIRKLDNDRLLG